MGRQGRGVCQRQDVPGSSVFYIDCAVLSSWDVSNTGIDDPRSASRLVQMVRQWFSTFEYARSVTRFNFEIVTLPRLWFFEE